MDWYYPVLGGALTGTEAKSRIEEGWDRFVVPASVCAAWSPTRG